MGYAEKYDISGVKLSPITCDYEILRVIIYDVREV
jgi:hypothetical protein